MNRLQALYRQHPLLCVFAFCFVCLLPLLGWRDFTPSNELRYLSIADEAIRDGHIFAFYNQGIPYADKPPLYLWIVTLSRLLLGRHCMFVLSLFSILPAFGVVALMDGWLKTSGYQDRGNRIATALMLLSTVMFIGSAIVLRMDMLMCLFIVLAIRSFYRLYEGGPSQHREQWLLPIWIFLALFSKGPVGFFMPLLVIIVFLLIQGEGRRIGEFLGWKAWSIMLGLFGLWMLGVYADGGKEYIENLLVHQTVGRAVHSFSHDKPFWYYFVHIWWIAAPWSLLAIPLMMWKWKGEKSTTERLFLTAVIVCLFMLSCFSAKLGVYLLPLLPFLIYLIPLTLQRCGLSFKGKKSIIIGTGLLYLIVFLAGFGITHWNDYIGYGNVCKAIPAGTEVSTLYVSRPENMDVYLGSDVRDFESDEQAFLAYAEQAGPGHALIIKEDKINSTSPLLHFLQNEKDHTKRIGPYLLILF